MSEENKDEGLKEESSNSEAKEVASETSQIEEAKENNADGVEVDSDPKVSDEIKNETDDNNSEKDSGEAKEYERSQKNTGQADIIKQLGLDDDDAPKKIIKAKGSKNISEGIIHINATFNNTIVTVTDFSGNVISWCSAGKMGMSGSRKSTAYAAQIISQNACRQAMSHGLKEAEVKVKGPGAGREPAVRAIQLTGIEVTKIRDVTPIPHNGCRPSKIRRV